MSKFTLKIKYKPENKCPYVEILSAERIHSGDKREVYHSLNGNHTVKAFTEDNSKEGWVLLRNQDFVECTLLSKFKWNSEYEIHVVPGSRPTSDSSERAVSFFGSLRCTHNVDKYNRSEFVISPTSISITLSKYKDEWTVDFGNGMEIDNIQENNYKLDRMHGQSVNLRLGLKKGNKPEKVKISSISTA